jgi:hypothetical protein
VACPFFMPIERIENGTWPHPARLPLGGGWSGHCTAPGHEGETPGQEELEFCNLGYAEGCARLPRERAWDAIRFALIAPAEPGKQNAKSATLRIIQLRYVCERRHRPAEHGSLAFDAAAAQWVRRHSDERVQKMAECFLDSYLRKKELPAAKVATG